MIGSFPFFSVYHTSAGARNINLRPVRPIRCFYTLLYRCTGVTGQHCMELSQKFHFILVELHKEMR